MKSYLAVLALAATVIAGNTKSGGTCNNGQVVVCKSNGNGGTLSLGNIAPGLLGQSCSGGNVYCCSEKDVKQVRSVESQGYLKH